MSRGDGTIGAVRSIRLAIPVPRGFDFWRTVRSHGWYALPPFSIDEHRRVLRRVLHPLQGSSVVVDAQGDSGKVDLLVTCDRPLSAGERRLVRDGMASCLRLGEDFTPFHRMARRHARTAWIARTGSGRLLRAPTVFEDLVKLICTTNCTWALTTVIVSNIVDAFGFGRDGEPRSFPRPEDLAGTTEAYLRREIRAGYRAPFLLRLAEEVATGKRRIEPWRESRLPTSELTRSIMEIRGVGPYAAGNLLRLLGRYEQMGFDSWVRARYAALYHGGRRVTDRTIERAYSVFGQWRGLVFWLEMTRSWHEEKFRRADGRREGE